MTNTFDPHVTIQIIVSFLQHYVKHAGFSDLIIGVSGGIDSATGCALAVRAVGAAHVHPVMMPYGTLNPRGLLDGKTLVQALHIPEKNIRIVDIQPFIDPFIGQRGMNDLRRGNAMARMRMIVLFDFAKALPGLVIGTENKSEHLLGYFTRFGDEASDIEPLRQLYKTQVYAIAKALALPDILLTKAPTAGLWEGQTDENELGFSYAVADQIFSLWLDEKQTIEAIMAKGFEKKIIEKVIARYESQKFKHHLPLMIE